MNLANLYEKSKSLTPLTYEEGLFLLNTDDSKLEELLDYANQLKLEFVGREIIGCGIINARSGKCSEDCTFCAQSSHHETNVPVHGLLNENTIVNASERARQEGVYCFSIVTSGKGAGSKEDFAQVLDMIPKLKTARCCVSMGILTKDQILSLKNKGLRKIHHNLETARSHFAKMCTTHTYEQRVQTILDAKELGLEVCCGGIFGIGESTEQRIEFAMEIRDLDVDSVPINILHPIAGTKIYGQTTSLRPQDILKLIATYRFLMPQKTIGVFGGREQNLGEWQPQLFKAGANSILIGNYLTTTGNKPEQDSAMVADAGCSLKT